jgi:hypothetical protein
MRKLTKIFLFITFIFCFSCEDQGFIVKCPDCTQVEPTDTNLSVKLEPGFFQNQVLLNIYEGNLEDSIIYKTFILSNEVVNARVTLNKTYTLTATYTSDDGTTYVAVDAVTPRVKYDKDQCDDPCFFVYDKTVDLRLKYTK